MISQSAYDGCADVWSAGITAIELSKGAPPYANRIHPFQAILLIPKVWLVRMSGVSVAKGQLYLYCGFGVKVTCI